MPYKLSYDKEERGVITTFYGVVTDEILADCIAERFKSKDAIKNTRYYLSDYTEVTEFNVTPQGVRNSAAIAIEASKKNRNIIVIGIVPDKTVYGMARMWQAYADVEVTGWETMIFKTYEEAEIWLAKNL